MPSDPEEQPVIDALLDQLSHETNGHHLLDQIQIQFGIEQAGAQLAFLARTLQMRQSRGA